MRSQTKRPRTTITRRIAVAILVAGLLAAGGAIWASLFSSNPRGASLLRIGADIWAGSSQANDRGAGVDVAATFTGSRDTKNPCGATAYIGHLDPVEPGKAQANPVWLDVE